MFDTLKSQGLNCARIWLWWGCEAFPAPNDRDSRQFVVPYLRTGPGAANDGKPRYDLTKFGPIFFMRLQALCRAARERGIFLQLILFDAWTIKQPELRRLHAFHRYNNINGVDGDPTATGVGTDGKQGFCSLGNAKVLEMQKAYIREVVDAVNAFGKFYFEIANENYYSPEWEQHLGDFLHQHERSKPRQHL